MDSETFGNRKNYSSHHSVLSTTPKWQFEDEIEEDHFLVRKHLYRYFTDICFILKYLTLLSE